MSNVLLAWELGSGLGHLGPLRAIGIEFVRRGHQVAIATNNVPLCRQGFAGLLVVWSLWSPDDAPRQVANASPATDASGRAVLKLEIQTWP